MNNELEQYRYLIDDKRNLNDISYRELQQIAGILAPLGFFPICRNVSKKLLVSYVCDGLVELDVALNPHKFAENVPNSSTEPSPITLAECDKRWEEVHNHMVNLDLCGFLYLRVNDKGLIRISAHEGDIPLWSTVSTQDAIIWLSRYKEQCAWRNAHALVETAVETPAKPVKRHYPIRIDASLIQSWICWSDFCQGTLTEWVNEFFSRPHEEDVTLTLLWSKAQ